jgi:hypothetical protein
MRFGFCGRTYQPQTPLADAELSINWYPEQMESSSARTAWALLPTPGLSLFATLAGGIPRGFCTVSGRTFVVGGTHLYELTANGVLTDYGGNPATANNNILNDGLPVTMIGGGTAGGIYPGQLAIASGGTLTVFLLATNAFAAITAAPANILMIDYLDGFFVALQSNNIFQISNPEDATTWTGLSVSQVSVFSDQLLAIIATNRLLWVFGAKRAVAYYNAGLPIFPFAVLNGGFMEVGILAQYSVARVATANGTTICWLGGDERGAGMVFAAAGQTATRVSDHGFEYWMQSQKVNITDAVGFATQENGHNFYWLWFPTANATWRLDVDLNMWHRMSSIIKGVQGQGAHLARCHTYNFGLHLVGDRNSGNVYSMSTQYLSEMTGIGISTPIVRTRIGPTVSAESSQNPMPINEFQVDFETGLGPQPPLTDGFGNPRDPYAVFSYSEDFGKTWTPDRMIACGKAGNSKVAAIDRRLGSWASFTPKVVVSDPIPWRIADAYINPTESGQDRLARKYLAVS